MRQNHFPSPHAVSAAGPAFSWGRRFLIVQLQKAWSTNRGEVELRHNHMIYGPKMAGEDFVVGEAAATAATTPTRSPKHKHSSLGGSRFRSPSQDQIFICSFPFCDATFNRGWKLDAHLCRHTGEVRENEVGWGLKKGTWRAAARAVIGLLHGKRFPGRPTVGPECWAEGGKRALRKECGSFHWNVRDGRMTNQ